MRQVCGSNAGELCRLASVVNMKRSRVDWDAGGWEAPLRAQAVGGIGHLTVN
jgi:hypothetical protein